MSTDTQTASNRSLTHMRRPSPWDDRWESVCGAGPRPRVVDSSSKSGRRSSRRCREHSCGHQRADARQRDSTERRVNIPSESSADAISGRRPRPSPEKHRRNDETEKQQKQPPHPCGDCRINEEILLVAGLRKMRPGGARQEDCLDERIPCDNRCNQRPERGCHDPLRKQCTLPPPVQRQIEQQCTAAS